MIQTFIKRFSRQQYKHGIAIIIMFALAVWDKLGTKPVVASVPASEYKERSFQYKTIPVSDSSNELIAYEFHKRPGDYQSIYNCSVIIRRMDPAKDDYKLYSKAIVADVIRSLGTDELNITVYDDYNAYTLEEVKSNQFGGISKSEQDSVSQHVVATYGHDPQQCSRAIRSLDFYTYAANKYTEKSVYEDEVVVR